MNIVQNEEAFVFPTKKARVYDQQKEEYRQQVHINKWPSLHDQACYENVDEEVKKSQVILIRHANSISNNLSEQLMEKLGNGNYTKGQWLDIQFSPDVIDCKLSQKGIEQCLEASKYTQKINFQEVHMSPMRRAVETAFYSFKNHPNLKNIRFYVDPLIREKITIAADLPVWNSYQMLQEEYVQQFKDIGVDLDLSDIQKACEQVQDGPSSEQQYPWYFYQFSNDFQNSLIKRHQENPYNDFLQNLLDVLEDDFPVKAESVQSVRERSQKYGQKIFNYIDQFNLDHQNQQDAKIAVVSHSMFIKILIADQLFWDEKFIKEPIESQEMPEEKYSKLMMNCELRAFIKNF